MNGATLFKALNPTLQKETFNNLSVKEKIDLLNELDESTQEFLLSSEKNTSLVLPKKEKKQHKKDCAVTSAGIRHEICRILNGKCSPIERGFIYEGRTVSIVCRKIDNSQRWRLYKDDFSKADYSLICLYTNESERFFLLVPQEAASLIPVSFFYAEALKGISFQIELKDIQIYLEGGVKK